MRNASVCACAGGGGGGREGRRRRALGRGKANRSMRNRRASSTLNLSFIISSDAPKRRPEGPHTRSHPKHAPLAWDRERSTRSGSVKGARCLFPSLVSISSNLLMSIFIMSPRAARVDPRRHRPGVYFTSQSYPQHFAVPSVTNLQNFGALDVPLYIHLSFPSPSPGPTQQRLGEHARQRHAHIQHTHTHRRNSETGRRAARGKRA